MADQSDDDPSKIKVTIHKSAEAGPAETAAEPIQPESEPESEPESKAAAEPEPSEVPAEDSQTEEAVDDIVANEGDTMLALEDAKTKKRQNKGQPSGWRAKLRRLAKSKWTWAVVALLLVVVFAVPVSRYKILGLVLKKTVTVSVVDSTTATPVSNAQVKLGGAAAKTDGEGQAKLKAALGSHSLTISKQYYHADSQAYSVGLKSPAPIHVKLVATGRLVPITVVNKISGQPLAGVQITVHGTTAKTNSKGLATVALPAKPDTDSAKLSLSGYNAGSVSITVTASVVKANAFGLTPAGQIYFLSNASGTIDVVKTNLDGSGRQTILAGTGKEDANNTSLLASRDWRYLVLEASRDSSQPALYLIDTSTGKVTEFDNTNSTFQPIGWYGHDFMYGLTSNTVPVSQSGHQIIKSYDADQQQLNQLDQDQALGTADSYGYQYFSNFYILNDQLVYTVQWFNSYGPGGAYDLSSQTDSIRGIQPGGQSKKDYQTFPAATTSGIQAALYEPQSLYFAVQTSGSNQSQFYEFEDQAVKTANIDQTAFSQAYPTYLVSPSGNQTFWTELRDGQNTLFTGDINAGSAKQVGSYSDYTPYGWYGDGYLLVSKNSSQLYILPAGGLKAGVQPLKVTDYYKPAQNFAGYGYGYGGL